MRNLHFEKLLPYMDQFLKGFGVTIQVTVVSFAIAIVLAITLAAVRMTNIKPLVILHDVWVLIIRSMPLLLQLFLMAYAVPALTGGKINLGAVLSGEAVLAINASAYMTESIRGGFLGVDRGQKEAAQALGTGNTVSFFYIILPQAFRHIFPSLMNEIILQFKSTSLLAQIGVYELFLVSNNMTTATHASFEPFLLVAVIYYIVVMVLTYCSQKIEGRLRRSDKN